MQEINQLLQQIQLGTTQAVHNLTMTPLLRDEPSPADYLTLDEALALGVAKVTEISDQGSVPELRFRNNSDKGILLLDGEELVGAKQNRIVNVTIFAPAHHELVIPVSCVEAGRWSVRSREFSSAGRAMYAEGRARKTAHVSESLAMGLSRQSRQGDVWDDISLKSMRMGSNSPTAAMDAMYEDNRHSLDEYRDEICAENRQVGAIFEVNGGITGLELFDSDSTLKKLLPKVTVSYALDAIDSAGRTGRSGNDRARIIAELGNAECQSYPALGHGQDIRIHGANLTGSALIHNRKVVHLCAFITAADDRRSDSFESSMLSARRRRMMRR